MNRILLLAFIIISPLAAFAGKNDITIKGTITHQLADEVIFSYVSYEGNWLNFREHEVSKELDKNGNFLVMLPLDNPFTLIQISNGEQATEIYGSPGDKIVMTVDAADFDNTLVYEGVGMKADVANFMAKHMLKMGFTQNFYREAQKIMVHEPEQYIAKLDEMIQKEMDFLIDNSAGLPQAFIKFWNATYEYSKYENMLTYPYMHEIVKAKSYDYGDIPKENYVVVEQVPAKFNDEYLHVSQYRQYISNFYTQKLSAENAGKEETTNPPYWLDDKALELAHQKMPRGSEEYVLADYIRSQVKYSPIERTEQNFEVFTNRYSGSNYSGYLETLIEKKKKLSAGSPAIDFTVNDETGKKVKLSDLKGKVVYLDFWASWCGPCKAQFPHVAKIKEHFAGKDVVFVYISIDENKEAWEKAMEKYKITGLHTREDGGWKAKTAQEYGVQGIPAYFIIDREGKFAVDTAPRPSQGEKLIEIIEGLL